MALRLLPLNESSTYSEAFGAKNNYKDGRVYSSWMGLHVFAWFTCLWNWPPYTVSDCLREWLWYCIHCGPWVSQFSKSKVIFLSKTGHSMGRFFDRRLNYRWLYILPYYSSIIQSHWFFYVRVRNINSFSVPHLVHHFKVLELFEFIFLLITAMWFQEMEMES